ncbi:MAG: hypothetical protein R3F56_16275 [Planctomycetota bacterium]
MNERRAATGLALLGLAACSAPPLASFAPPAVTAAVQLRSGSMLTGPHPPNPQLPNAQLTESGSPEPTGEAVAVRVTWTWLAECPDGLAPAATRARSMVTPTDAQPFAVGTGTRADPRVAVAETASRVLAAVGEGGASSLSAAIRDAALWRGTTAVFEVTAGVSSTIRLALERDASGTVRPLLVMPRDGKSGMPAPTGTDADAAPSPLVVFDDPLAPGAAFVCVDAALPGPTLLWQAQVLGAASEGLRRAASEGASWASPAGPHQDDAASRTLAVLRQALAHSWTRRRTLVLLAEQHAVPLVADLALVGDDPLLAEVATSAAPVGDADATPMGWRLESAAVAALAKRAQNEPLPPEIDSVAQLYLGETVRAPSSLLAVLARGVGRDAFAAWLREEHLALLADSHPATRVRAFAWLTARHVAVDGYDPMASKASRRAALAALEQRSSEQRSAEQRSSEKGS